MHVLCPEVQACTAFCFTTVQTIEYGGDSAAINQKGIRLERRDSQINYIERSKFPVASRKLSNLNTELSSLLSSCYTVYRVQSATTKSNII
jgi:hypothetical protein